MTDEKITMPDDESVTICIPKYVGYWKVINNFHIQSDKRPNRLIRFFNRLLIGWIWVDEGK